MSIWFGRFIAGSGGRHLRFDRWAHHASKLLCVRHFAMKTAENTGNHLPYECSIEFRLVSDR
jgi:hypothetical protein